MTATPLHPDALGTLCGLFRARVAAMPKQLAYRQFDEARDAWVSFTWAEVAAGGARGPGPAQVPGRNRRLGSQPAAHCQPGRAGKWTGGLEHALRGGG